jgi:hypothetical protein
MVTDRSAHRAIIAWTHQQNPDFHLFAVTDTHQIYKDHRLFGSTVEAIIQNRVLKSGIKLHPSLSYPYYPPSNSTRRLDSSSSSSNKAGNAKKSKDLLKLKGNSRGKQRDYLAEEERPRKIYPPIVPRPAEKIELLLLDRWSVLRYCNKPQVGHHPSSTNSMRCYVMIGSQY